jgi:N-acetylmuramoyl-L-alanine amidase
LNSARNSVAASLLTLVSLSAFGQTLPKNATPQVATPPAPTPVPINRLVILLDPAHGGVDSGSRIGDSTLEKDVTLALAFKLRSLLSARGFTVVMTRDADNPTEPNAAGSPLTLDDRAGIANHSHALACLLLHATASGSGVHLYSSELAPTAGVATPEPWLTAQSAWIPASQELGRRMATALSRAGIAMLNSSASVRPVDSLACPALVIELAPESDDADSITDADYQQRVALALAGALVFWQTQAQPPIRLAPVATAHLEQQP